jgi:hypothetical protein
MNLGDFDKKSASMLSKSDPVVDGLAALTVSELQKATKSVHPTPPNSPSPARLSDNCKESDKDKRHSEVKDGGASGADSSILLTPPPSPPRSTSKSTSDGQPAKNTAKIDHDALKTLLSLDNGRCGCLTKLKKPCKIPIAERKKAKIDDLIESMLTFISSSPELQDKLEKLAKLVHCRYHDHETSMQSRVEQWITAFPDGDPATKPRLSLERQVTKALDGVSTKCIGKTKAQKDCSRGIGGQKVQNCTSTINQIVYSVTYQEDADEIGYLVRVFEYNRLCNCHDKQPFKHVELWKSRVMEIHRTWLAERAKLADDATPSDPQNRLLSMPRHLRPSPLDLNMDPAEYWPVAYDVSPFSIIERSDRLNDSELAYKEIGAQARSCLDVKAGDLKPGYVYLYEVEGNKGFVKIGYTSRTTAERHEEWAFACNRAAKLLYPDSPNAQKVPNARRVEALCHAELHHRRLRIYCTGCLKQHIEWFEIAPVDAIAVIQKWSKWIASNPYEEMKLRGGSKWVLKTEETKRLKDIKTFLKDISPPVNQPRH